MGNSEDLKGKVEKKVKKLIFGMKISSFWTEKMIFFRWCLLDVGMVPMSRIAVFDNENDFFFCTRA